MNSPTVHIMFQFVDGPWGGGNQFLRGLKKQFQKDGVYEEAPERADIILFNSNPDSYQRFLDMCYRLRAKYRKTIINRMAGPIFLARGHDRLMDKAIYFFDARFTDGTIFQSGCSMQENLRLGMREKANMVAIMNAPDPEIFYPADGQKIRREHGKIKIIANSWSSNPRKGFDIYRFLDEHLDFSKYDMSFYGNSCVPFKNIRLFKPCSSSELADKLRESDLFINASVYEACSNSLLEALHCGVPAVVRASSSDKEIVGGGGGVFEGSHDVLAVIDRAAENLAELRKKIALPKLPEVAEKYYDFCKKTHEATAAKQKKARPIDYLCLRALLKVRWQFLKRQAKRRQIA